MRKLTIRTLALVLALILPVLTPALAEDIAAAPVEPVAESVEAELGEAEAAVEAPEIIAEAAPADAAVETVTVSNKATLTLNVGETRQLAVEGKTIKRCKSGKKKVASVSKTGLVKAKAAGKAKITVKLAGKKGRKLTVTVKVVDPYAPSGVTIVNGKSAKLAKGDTLQLSAAIAPETAQSGLTWSSSKKKVATVDQNGLVTARKKGKATITVKTRNGKKAKIKVTVTKAAAQPAEPAEPAQPAGKRTDLTVYLGQNLEKTAASLGLKWEGTPGTPTGSYGNSELAMGWALEKYWDEAVVEHITINRDDSGKYSLYGLYLGMSEADARAMLGDLGFSFAYSYDESYTFKKGKTGFSIEIGSKGTVTSLYVNTDW